MSYKRIIEAAKKIMHEDFEQQEEAWMRGYKRGAEDAEEGFRKDIERLIEETKNGILPVKLCAVRIDAYNELLSLIGKKK